MGWFDRKRPDNDGFQAGPTIDISYSLDLPALAPATESAEPAVPVVALNELSNWTPTEFTGNKFFGGYGETFDYLKGDYWLLRKRSAQLFTDNLYARGLIRRLITNEINTGLSPEATPVEEIIGVPDDSLADWTETVEMRFGLWGKTPGVCDWYGRKSFGAIQRIARAEALISGDVLVVLRQHRHTKLPSIQLVSGESVRTPFTTQRIAQGHTIKHGIEYDAQGREFGYWIQQKDASFKRMPAWGEKSGRRIAWLVYGTDRRLDDARGQPLLSIVLQSLRELDRYRDSTQRKAMLNSMVAAAVKKTKDKMGTLPLQGGATRKDAVAITDSEGQQRKMNLSSFIPGMVIDELQDGEELQFFGGQGTDEAFGMFEETITAAIAWANEVPPEIYRLAFSNNYSASQAAINEFKIYLNKFWSEWGDDFCSPIWQEWLISEALQQRVTASTLLAAWRDPSKFDVFAAWVSVEWYGSIKPSTDMLKSTKGSKNLVDEAWSTNAREARGLTGTKFSRNVKRLKRENEQKAEALRPLLEMHQELKSLGADSSGQTGGEGISDPADAADELAEEIVAQLHEVKS